MCVQAQNESREFNGYRWYDDGITFTYPLSVAQDARAVFTPATVDTREEVKVIFENYHDDGWLPTGAEIAVLNVTSIQVESSDLAGQLMELANGDEESQLQLTGLLPTLTGAIAQITPLNFQTGSGVRFVTQMTETESATGLAYHFIGITDDNTYLVSATFPVTAVALEDSAISDAEVINALTADAFTPELTTLDTLINSLQMLPPDAFSMTAQTGGNVNDDGVHFSYDASLAYRIEVDHVAPITGQDAEQNMFGVTPGYTLFSFVGYPAVGAGQQPQLFVMPVSEFPDTDQPYGIRIAELQNFLTEKPELHARSMTSNPDNALPILPVMNAAQTIVSQPLYMRFANGEGVRYVAYYSQSAEPISANDLFYVFVGMSDDHQYAVAAIFPLFAGFLPHGRALYNIADIDQFNLNYGTYLEGVLLQTNIMATSAFVPDIQALDNIVKSITLP